LCFGSLGHGDSAHLNAIAARWRDAKEQIARDRWQSASERQFDGRRCNPVRITFPDTAGEAYGRMWEERECDVAVAKTLQAGDVMLFIHADTIQPPMWVVDEIALAAGWGYP